MILVRRRHRKMKSINFDNGFCQMHSSQDEPDKFWTVMFVSFFPNMSLVTVAGFCVMQWNALRASVDFFLTGPGLS